MLQLSCNAALHKDIECEITSFSNHFQIGKSI